MKATALLEPEIRHERCSVQSSWVARSRPILGDEWFGERRRRSIVSPLAELSEAITASRRILEFPDDWDDAGSPAFKESTWRRAAGVLRQNAELLWSSHGLLLPTPQILPGPVGSIDIHWRSDRRELLINIPENSAAPATYYGDDFGNDKRRGDLSTGGINLDLFAWLIAAD